MRMDHHLSVCVRRGLHRMLCISAALMLALCGTASAHGGRLDSRNGHKDRKNKSGLGSYHYHCYGKPAHLHRGGVCQYAPKDRITVRNMPSSMSVGDAVDLMWTLDTHSGSDRVEWSSSDPSVAEVSSNGRVVAVSAGKATITAKLKNGVSTYAVTIRNVEVREIKLSASMKEWPVGSVVHVRALITPGNATNQTLLWSSDKEDVAMVFQDGVVLVLGEGVVTRTAESLDGGRKRAVVQLTATTDPNVVISADSIMAQLPSSYRFAVKPGSAAARFVQQHGLPFAWADMLLREGCSGADVLMMTLRLRELGYFPAGTSFGEQYNETTTERVRMFQRENNLPQTGEADLATLVLLYSDAAKGNPGK